MREIMGFFTWPTLYADIVNEFIDGSRFVEVGVLAGQSLIYLVGKMMECGKKIEITGVDHFTQQSEGYLEIFKNNTADISDKFDLIIDESVNAAKRFEDKSLDFVFIDAKHGYEHVKADIEAWMPKIRNGGIIAGHDYIPTYPGVMEAVDEIFKDKVDKKYAHEGCWLVKL